jgi:hypothetical protein
MGERDCWGSSPPFCFLDLNIKHERFVMENEKIKLSSELVVETSFGDHTVQIHLVGWSLGESEERFGLWLETETGGVMISMFNEDVDFDTAVSFFVALAMGVLVNGSERAAETLSLNGENGLIIPDTETVQEITK